MQRTARSQGSYIAMQCKALVMLLIKQPQAVLFDLEPLERAALSF
jgi:hypothetical protein